MTDIAELVLRNNDFAAGEFVDGARLTIKATGDMMVIGCVDPRVDPAHVLRLGHGEAVVIRNPGGRITPATLRAMTTLNKVTAAHPESRPGGTWNLVILHHTSCGLADLASDDDVLAEYFETPASELAAKSVGDPRGSVRADVDLIHRLIHRPNFLVSGLVYDVRTGRVEVVVPPTQVG